MATVTACHYEFGAGQALAFGIPMSKHFRISINYWVGDELHTGEYMSKTAVPQGTMLPITYNPDAPHEHGLPGARPPRASLVIISVVTAFVVLAATLLTMHGCHTR